MNKSFISMRISKFQTFTFSPACPPWRVIEENPCPPLFTFFKCGRRARGVNKNGYTPCPERSRRNGFIRIISAGVIILLISVGLMTSLSAGEIPLVFNENKIEIGTLYDYEYSTESGEYKPRKYHHLFYVKSNELVEELAAIYPYDGQEKAFLDEYTFNWDYMTIASTKFSRLGYTDEDLDDVCINCTIKNHGTVDFVKNLFIFSHTNKVEEGLKTYSKRRRIIDYPTYFYDITADVDLWYSLKFFPMGNKRITVYELNGGHNVKVVVEYLGEEKITVPYGSILCHKFQMVPNSYLYKLLAEDIFIWLSAEDETMYMVRYENNNARNSFEHRFEIRLTDRKKMAPDEWEALKQQYEK